MLKWLKLCIDLAFINIKVSPQLQYSTPIILFSLVLMLFTSTHSAQLSAAENYNYLPDTEVNQLTVDGKTTDVLVRAWYGKKHLGAAIIIGASDTNADSAGLASYLRKSLNPIGWATLSLTPAKGLYRPNYITAAEEIAKEGKE